MSENKGYDINALEKRISALENGTKILKDTGLNFAEVITDLANLASNKKFNRPFWGGKLYATLQGSGLELRVEWDSEKDCDYVPTNKDCAYVPTNEDIFAKDWMVVDE